ncbi:MAG: SAF domain-containing protein [Actinomycetota bacterium]
MSLTLLSRSPRSESSTPPASPPAARAGRPWWRDGRVIGGILIVIISAIVGARLMASGDDTVPVWQVDRDVAAGTVLSADDVTAVSVPASAAAAYAPATGLPADRLTRDLQALELVPAAVDALVPDVRWVTVPVEPLHAPTDLLAGEPGDVWAR